MMRPKGKMIALLAIFAAIGMVVATGAFTSVSATRTAQVNVAGDAAALLQLQPAPGSNGQDYAQLNGNDQLEINLNGGFGSSNAQGVNLNGTTDVQTVFNITNQGTQTVAVNISDSGDNNGLVTFYNASFADRPGGLESDDGGDRVSLDSGETIVVSIYINTENSGLGDGDELVDSITIEATTDTSGSVAGPS